MAVKHEVMGTDGARLISAEIRFMRRSEVIHFAYENVSKCHNCKFYQLQFYTAICIELNTIL